MSKRTPAYTKKTPGNSYGYMKNNVDKIYQIKRIKYFFSLHFFSGICEFYHEFAEELLNCAFSSLCNFKTIKFYSIRCKQE